ncbi:hypothetical protein [Streptomyces bicolor]|uniref:hypothetical protein n=1 Tax=Streptomyces bicolor TaxID=66874 RepID=UPI00131A83B1|nr:hypothetical protein [Streptomyces bicolor]
MAQRTTELAERPLGGQGLEAGADRSGNDGHDALRSPSRRRLGRARCRLSHGKAVLDVPLS